MQACTDLFKGIEYPRTGTTNRHDMLMIGLLAIICGGGGCADMALLGRGKEDFLRRFPKLEHGMPKP
ncbi:MAG: transposase family protein [Rhodobacteraceae bacterium]|nr:transposase family protein [Paracoccaceae bacterium]MCY4250738.1 transposase family protein [Paracoccaceae bacterium]